MFSKINYTLIKVKINKLQNHLDQFPFQVDFRLSDCVHLGCTVIIASISASWAKTIIHYYSTHFGHDSP